MKKYLRYTSLLGVGFVLGFISNMIKYSYYEYSGLTYYKLGFPFVHANMLGDAPLLWEPAIYFNYIFWILVVALVYFGYNIVMKNIELKKNTKNL